MDNPLANWSNGSKWSYLLIQVVWIQIKGGGGGSRLPKPSSIGYWVCADSTTPPAPFQSPNFPPALTIDEPATAVQAEEYRKTYDEQICVYREYKNVEKNPSPTYSQCPGGWIYWASCELWHMLNWGQYPNGIEFTLHQLRKYTIQRGENQRGRYSKPTFQSRLFNDYPFIGLLSSSKS